MDRFDEDEELNKQLFYEAETGNENKVHKLLQKGADVNCRIHMKETPLHKAAKAGQDRIVKILLEAGAEINAQDYVDNTPLHFAVLNGHSSSVQVLVEQGANVHVKDQKEFTPLHLALRSILFGSHGTKMTFEAIAEILVKAGSDISAKDIWGSTPLDYAGEELKGSLEILSSEITKIKDVFPSIAGTKEFRVLLMRGTYSSHNNRVYLAGACKVGKSTLASNLIGQKIPKTWKSTDGLIIYFGRNGIHLLNKEMVPLPKGSIDSILASVLRGQPSLDQSAVFTEEENLTKCTALPKTLEDDAVLSDTLETENAQASFVSLPPPKPTLAKKFKQLFVKREEEQHGLPVSKQGDTDVRKSIMEAIRKGKYKVLIAPSDLVDFGGQKAFDLTHQLFIQQKGAFVLLLDGRKDLDDILTEYQDGKMTTREILLHWINSILTYCSADDDDIYPLIIFAATHRDQLTQDQESSMSEYLKIELMEMFRHHEHCKRITYQKIFFIDATDTNDLGVLSLKQFLVKVAFEQKSWGEQMPMGWVPLELQIAELRSNNVFIISYDELYHLNMSNDDLSLPKTQFKAFLKCQHALGQLMYFDIQRLDKFVIIQPTAMVDVLRSLITDKIFWPKKSALHSILSTASKTGVIKKRDLFRLWSQDQFNKYIQSPDIRDFITQILIHLDILVEPKRFHRTYTNLTEAFIVPGMIRQSLPSKFLPFNLDGDKTIVLSYRLLKSAIPNALVYKLIGAVVNIWPLKTDDKMWYLFDKAAVLEIDQVNDLYLTFRDNRFIVALSNKKLKNYISPDIASIIQECLTLTMTKVLEFYTTSFGKSASSTDITNFCVTEVGANCTENICFIGLSDIKHQSSWTCHHNKEHSTRFPLYWAFDKKQEMCVYDCKGLDPKALNDVPLDKHLIRLVKLIGREFNQFIIYLGLTKDEWNYIEDETKYSDILAKRFVGLCEWREKKQASNSLPTFKHLAKALSDIDYSYHFLCQIFREKFTEVFAMDNPKLLEIPDESVLQELSRNVGHHTLHLGVELGLEMSTIEETEFRYSKDMFAQTYDILIKWKTTCKVQPTVRALMLALRYVDLRGFRFLKTQYGVENAESQDK